MLKLRIRLSKAFDAVDLERFAGEEVVDWGRRSSGSGG